MVGMNPASTEVDLQLNPQISFTLLPKEIRLQIWGLAYFAQPPRLVALRTKPHDEYHDHDVFCPRYSPSPAPTIVNVCHEARAEACYQARKAGHLVSLPVGLIIDRTPQLTEQFYFRFETDILYLPFDDAHARHHDELPENGFLAHFAYASGCDTKTLRNIAITKVVWSGYHDGSFSNALRDYPNISHMIMTVPLEARDDPVKKTTFVRAARRITALYKWDQYNLLAIPREVQVDVDFATINKGKMDIISKGKWKEWSELGNEWVSNETGRHFFATAFSS